MSSFKNIKDSDNFPKGIKKLQDGKLFIDVEIIKSFMFGIINADIEYFDGTRITWWPKFETEINLDKS